MFAILYWGYWNNSKFQLSTTHCNHDNRNRCSMVLRIFLSFWFMLFFHSDPFGEAKLWRLHQEKCGCLLHMLQLNHNSCSWRYCFWKQPGFLWFKVAQIFDFYCHIFFKSTVYNSLSPDAAAKSGQGTDCTEDYVLVRTIFLTVWWSKNNFLSNHIIM